MTQPRTIAAEVRQEHAASDPAKTHQRWLAFVVGLIAFLLPAVLFLGPMPFARIGTEELGGCARYSLSHFYYSPFWGGVFIGMLAFIGTYMVTYRGDTADETWTARIAGLCAFGVALIPAKDHGCLDPDSGTFRSRAFGHFSVDENGVATAIDAPTHDQPWVSKPFVLFDYELPIGINVADLHYFSALVLFVALLYFCFFVFTRKKPYHTVDGVRKTTIKKVRNTIYLICGGFILLSMAMLGYQFQFGDDSIASDWNRARGTFFWESVALLAFGVSWLTKGRFYERISSLGRE